MSSATHLTNIEQKQKIDQKIMKQLAKIMESLPNIED